MASLSFDLRLSCNPGTRVYRLIDAVLLPHPQLDGTYESMEEAMRDAIGWLDGRDPTASQACIGLDVSTRHGDWRTIRLPVPLLCPLPLAT